MGVEGPKDLKLGLLAYLNVLAWLLGEFVEITIDNTGAGQREKVKVSMETLAWTDNETKGAKSHMQARSSFWSF
jgi:hypothetical protein